MKNYVFLAIIIFLTAIILVQNQVYNEHRQVLEENFWIAYHWQSLKKGMSKDEVLKILGFPPENVAKELGGTRYKIFKTEDGRTGIHWSNYRKRTFQEIFGITYEPKSSMGMNLILDFDKDERLISIYYGG